MDRKTANREYEIALKKAHRLESGTDEAAWIKANDELNKARRAMVECELANPTKREIAGLWQRSRTAWRD